MTDDVTPDTSLERTPSSLSILPSAAWAGVGSYRLDPGSGAWVKTEKASSYGGGFAFAMTLIAVAVVYVVTGAPR